MIFLVNCDRCMVVRDVVVRVLIMKLWLDIVFSEFVVG